jgi:Na+/melibiose symporter-like transporter
VKTKTAEKLPPVNRYIPKKEYWLYSFGALGQGMIYSTMSSYVSDFYTNVLQLPLLFVLLLMLFARIWDAVNDPMMGMIVDSKTTKWGKMKPYIIFTAIPIGVLTFLMFYYPDISRTNLMIYAAAVYVLWGMIYTVSDVPFWSLPNAMTPNPDERSSLISTSRTLNGIGSALPMLLFFMLGFVLPKVAANANPIEMNKLKYICIAVVSLVIGIILFVNSYFHIKERVVIPAKKRVPGEKSRIGRIFSCRPLMLVVISGVLSSGRYMIQAASLHVARYSFYIGPKLTSDMPIEMRLANIEKSIASVNTIFLICAAVGSFGAMLCMPIFTKRFNYKQIVIFTCIAGFAASIVTTLVGWYVSLYACIPFILISSIPIGVLNIASYAMIGDSLDYMEWKTGFRDTALGSACQSFVNKLDNALATTGIILMYMLIGLDPSKMLSSEVIVAATEIAVGQRFAMFSLVSIVPGVSMLLCSIPIFFYDLVGEKREKVTVGLAAARKERGVVVE